MSAALPSIATASPVYQPQVPGSIIQSQTIEQAQVKESSEVESTHKLLTEAALKVLTEITKINFDCCRKPTVAAIEKGLHRDLTYYKHLISLIPTAENDACKKSLQARLALLRDKGHFYKGIFPKKYFELTKTQNGEFPKVYCLKISKEEKGIKNLLPSNALTNLREGLTFIGDGEGCQIAYYESLRNFLTSEKFNELFHSGPKVSDTEAAAPLTIGMSNAFDPINVLRRAVVIKHPSQIKRGQWVTVPLVELFAKKHLCDPRTERHFLCLEEGENPKFLSFGMNPSGVDQKQIAAELVSEFNQPPIKNAEIGSEAYAKDALSHFSRSDLDEAEKLKDAQVTDLSNILNGGHLEFQEVYEFDVSFILQLKKGTPSEARTLLWSRMKKLKLELDGAARTKEDEILDEMDKAEKLEIPAATVSRLYT